MRDFSLLRGPFTLRAVVLCTICVIADTTLVGACSPGAFDELRDGAGVLVAEAPDGYARSGFGSVLTSFGGPLDGVRVSRLAASAGADSQIRVYAAWTGTNVLLDPAAYDVCKDAGHCEPGAGASLTGVIGWLGGSLCVASGAPRSDRVLVRCDDSAAMSVTQVQPPPGTLGAEFGAALAGLPSGALLVGAPQGGTGGVGTVFLASDLGTTTELPFGAARGTGVTQVGAQLAAAPTSAGGALAAITASGGTRRRVIVVELDAAGTATLLACLEDTGSAFGSVVAVGVLVGGDDVPDVVVADDPGQLVRREEVRVYDGALLRAAGGACPAAVAPTIVACADTRGVACAGSGFGASLAIGDVDGDGDGDLAVGAPDATFRAVAQSGAVWLVPGDRTALDPAGADVLTDSEPVSSARLGASVAMVESRDAPPRSPPRLGDYARRSEVAAGAPGVAEVLVFLCSGLSGDGLSAGPLCIPAVM